jgi:membrane-associated phospholipid phosphatase
MLDKIASLDHGVHAHFHFMIRQHPELVAPMQLANQLGGYVGSCAVVALAVVVWLLRGQARAALLALLGFLGSFALIEAIRAFVQRERPDDAADTLTLDPLAQRLGIDQQLGSFPAPSVFLFTLAMLLFLFALTPPSASRRTKILLAIPAVVLILGVTMSQLMLSMHFLTDVVPALAASICIAYVLKSFQA